MRPFYSVIVVSYNAGGKLNQTLQSLLSQRFTDYEVIIKDGGSTDGSLSELPGDGRIRLLEGKDGGIYDAMNQAIAHAAGKILYFLDCGDVLHDPEVLGKVAEIIAQDLPEMAGTTERAAMNDAGVRGKAAQMMTHDPDRALEEDKQRFSGVIYYGNVIEMQTGQEVAANPQMSHFAMYRYLPCHQACFYTRDLFEERQFDVSYRVRADYEHFLWSVIRHGAQTVAMPLVVADYEGGGYSETVEGRERSAKEHKKITACYFPPGERFWFRLYLIVTLQPLREKMARGKHTAAIYDGIKNWIYRRRRK